MLDNEMSNLLDVEQYVKQPKEFHIRHDNLDFDSPLIKCKKVYCALEIPMLAMNKQHLQNTADSGVLLLREEE